jgi:hypothetical protein
MTASPSIAEALEIAEFVFEQILQQQQEGHVNLYLEHFLPTEVLETFPRAPLEELCRGVELGLELFKALNEWEARS